MKDVGTPAAECGRNLTESERRLCKHSFLVSVSENEKGVGVLRFRCHADKTGRVDGKSLTTCACHRRRAAAGFLPTRSAGFAEIVFNFQQPLGKRSLSPVCLTAGYRRLCYVRKHQEQMYSVEKKQGLFSETDPLHGLIWMESFRLDTNPASVLCSG